MNKILTFPLFFFFVDNSDQKQKSEIWGRLSLDAKKLIWKIGVKYAAQTFRYKKKKGILDKWFCFRFTILWTYTQ